MQRSEAYHAASIGSASDVNVYFTEHSINSQLHAYNPVEGKCMRAKKTSQHLSNDLDIALTLLPM